MSNPHISEMRQALMDTLRDLRDRDNPMDVDRAKAVAHVASVLVDSAKAEIDYIKATGADRSDFIEPPVTYHQPPLPNGTPTAHNPFPSVTHRSGI